MSHHTHPPLALNQEIDLVDFEELQLFMFRSDNLYLIGVPEQNRNQCLRGYYRQVARYGRPKSALHPGNIEQNEESKYFFQAYLWHLHQLGIEACLLDIGAYIGDFSLLLANFARTCSIGFRAICFDPSAAGTLIPFNIDLNDLGSFIAFEPLAIADVDGPVKFSYKPGHMDSASVAYGRANEIEYLVSAKRISTYIQANRLPHEGLIVKIDTEGIEALIILDLLRVVPPPTIIFEFSPGNMADNRIEAVDVLQRLSQWYYLYDVSHLPFPGRVRPISENNIAQFAHLVSGRACGYADILSVPRTIPGFDKLTAIIERMEKGRRGYHNFVGTSQGGDDW